ncbi:MAG: gliding motility-associated C-terminal domain-containing protein [Bacteroidota bacterium]
MRILLTALLLFLGAHISTATHLLGGDITWTCNGTGDYVFQLRIYRDCSGPSVNTAGQSLRVWNHPTLTSIPLVFVSQRDISPSCTPVAGGPGAIDCASGNGNAVEEYLFTSAPVTISGIPPAAGWAFTWDAFSRPNCDNLNNASTYGLTLRSVMFSNAGQNGSPCYDSSPQFSGSPVYIACNGSPFTFVQNAADPDLDSLVFAFDVPLDQIAAGVYNPPAFPVTVPYNAGYAFNNPTPDASFNAGNIASVMNAQSGDMDFTSFTNGTFIVVIRIESWRNGIKISEVYRELLLAVQNCGVNNAPVVTPPFAAGTSYNATFYAGELINFTISSNDNDTLQDGSPQSNTVEAQGNQFGAGFSNPAAGCLNAPCAVLNPVSPATNVQGVSTDFNWQSDCAHLPSGNSPTTYLFNFKFSDDFCSVPGITSKTVSITLLPPPAVAAPVLKCADVALNGDVTLSWISSTDPYNSFVQYEIYNNGTLIGSLNNINQNNFTHVGADAQNGIQSYSIVTRSGCNADQLTYSDTLSTMFLTVGNPGNGTAFLQWNALSSPQIPTSGWYQLFMEYPAGTWTMIDSVPYGTLSYIDTITVCSDTINFKIEVADVSGCVSTSSIAGENFQDVISPYEPEIINVTVDTLTGLAQINWFQNPSPDTQGYIVIQDLGGGVYVILDTVWGITNTSYTYLLSNASSTSEMFGIAAFDSCWKGNPAAPNTSAMGTEHNTIFISANLNICSQAVTLSWNNYQGWANGVSTYELYVSENGGVYTLLNSSASAGYVHSNVNRLSTYCYVVKAIENGTGVTSLSNKTCIYINQPPQPAYGYLQTATVENNAVELRYLADLSATVSGYRFERADDAAGPYNSVGTSAAMPNPVTLTDATALVNSYSYYYRVVVVDSCGDDALVSNYGRTILLTVTPNNGALINILQWNHYDGWDGPITGYNIYRSVNGVFDPAPVATVAGTQRYYEDDVSSQMQATGEFCYYVEALEGTNSYGISEVSHSNIGCAVIDPIIWVPNAFIINGVNNVFKPVASYVDFNEYDLKIFNRWGEMIFQTSDINTGWDGLHKSKQAGEGVYVWQIILKDGEGKTYEQRGRVTLLIGPKP